ncbi:hypothetical protein ACM66B_005830 [Microbotryomycetes sp. NB124-2]
MAPYITDEPIILEFQAPFAIVTLNIPKKLNAMDSALYKRLSAILQSIDRRDDIYCTVITGRGKFFSAGADVKQTRFDANSGADPRVASLGRLSEGNLDLARAMYRHSKVLVAGLNGPAIGLSAALLGHCDFVYAVENAYIMTPFSTLSLVCEGGASLTFPRRMGISKANEALLLGKKLGAAELHANGFINKLFPQSSDDAFFASLMPYLREKLEGLDLDAVLKSKALIRATLPDPDPSNIREVFAGAEQFGSGRPQERFDAIASKKIRHKI